MERSESRSGGQGQRRSSPEIVDLDFEEEFSRGRIHNPAEAKDVETDEDDIIVLDDNLEVQGLIADWPKIEFLTTNNLTPSTEVIDLDSDSDSEVQIVEIRRPVRGEEEENFPVSVEEKIESTKEEAEVARPNSETSRVGFNFSSVVEELGEVSLSTFSMTDVNRETEAQAADVMNLAESMGQVAIAESGNKSFPLEDGGTASGSSPQPTSSSNVLVNRSPPIDLAHQLGKETQSGNIPTPVEPVRKVGKTQIIYEAKPDFSSLSEQDKIKLRDRMLRRIIELQKQCKFDQYVQRYPPGSIKIENGFKTIVMEGEDGVTRKVICKPAECREADELIADPAYELPTRPTPTYLELLLQNVHLNEGEGASSHAKEDLAPGISNETVEASMSRPEVEQEKFDWDTQEDVDEFCKNLNDSFDTVTKERELEKKAKEVARLLGKENRKKTIAAMLAEVEKGGRKKTRLATGTIARIVTTPVKVGNLSPKSSVSPLERQPQKRKGSEVEPPSDNEMVAVPTLHRRPLSRPGPLVLKASPPPPPGYDAGWVKENVWEVERVVDARVEKNDSSSEIETQIMYKVKWRGWDSTFNSWIPETDILSKTPIKAFWRKLKKGADKLNGQRKSKLGCNSRTNKVYFTL